MEEKRIPAKLYKTEVGNEPVREGLKQLSPEHRKIIGADIKTVEYGWPIGMPSCRPIGKGLYEVRSNLPDSIIVRVLFYIYMKTQGLTKALMADAMNTSRQHLIGCATSIILRLRSKRWLVQQQHWTNVYGLSL